MNRAHAPATLAISRHPIHATLAPFPIVCFTLTLLTDIAYWQTWNLMWQQFSEWLLLAGLDFGALAALAGAVDFLEIGRVACQDSVCTYVDISVVADQLKTQNISNTNRSIRV